MAALNQFQADGLHAATGTTVTAVPLGNVTVTNDPRRRRERLSVVVPEGRQGTYRGQRRDGRVVFGLIAVLFNPIVPVYLKRAIWFDIDIGVAVIFAAHLMLVRLGRPQSKRTSANSTQI
jgi:hypothetical protein